MNLSSFHRLSTQYGFIKASICCNYHAFVRGKIFSPWSLSPPGPSIAATIRLKKVLSTYSAIFNGSRSGDLIWLCTLCPSLILLDALQATFSVLWNSQLTTYLLKAVYVVTWNHVRNSFRSMLLFVRKQVFFYCFIYSGIPYWIARGWLKENLIGNLFEMYVLRTYMLLQALLKKLALFEKVQIRTVEAIRWISQVVQRCRVADRSGMPQIW